MFNHVHSHFCSQIDVLKDLIENSNCKRIKLFYLININYAEADKRTKTNMQSHTHNLPQKTQKTHKHYLHIRVCMYVSMYARSVTMYAQPAPA